ncbi:transglycosylase domain-containing protein [Amnibacterium endophyticum]|uniref:Transglycosylase domain-containing protein n=1 Tax=Amnibacterium endophyticum TaxID=2109337 RepID=A0ABW4LFI9_9MICO
MSQTPRRPRPAAALAGVLGIAVVAALMITAGVAPAVAMTGSGKSSGLGLFDSLPDDYKIAAMQQKTEIYAKRGKKEVLLASFFNQDREVVTWDKIPDTVKNATLAAEDARFYEHGAVDPMGILRAIGANLVRGGSQGASTITQQYVKNVCVQEAELLPTQEQVSAAYAECTGGIKRKLREARLAIDLEKQYSKNDILLGYLNIAGFGGRIYGIESAAQYYYGTHVEDLTAAQAASLMAIVNSPNSLRIDEKANIAQNTVRRDYILKTELEHGMISKADYQEAVASKVKPKITPTQTGCAQAKSAAYFCSYVVNTIRNNKIFGDTPAVRDQKLQSAGWKIHTTLDLGLQSEAKDAMTASVPAKSPAGTDLGGAAVSVQVGTGRILSMVQSKRFDESQGKDTKGAGYTATAVNWNTDVNYGGSNGFQPGSTYKAFTLIDWLEHGHGLNEIVDGTGKTWPAGSFPCASPDGPFPAGNDTAGEGGYQTVMLGTARSVNGVFASMASKLNLCDIRSQAQKLLVHRANLKELQVNPSSILGTNEVAPLTMATAYSGIANKGEVCSPIAIDRIETSDGSKVDLPKADCHQAIPSGVAVAAGYALHGVLTGGTAAADAPSTGGAWGFAKTGTTNDAKSTWVVGGTTKVVNAVWVGNVNAQTTNLRQVFGWSPCQRTAADARHCVWSGVMRAAQAKYPGDTSWPQPEAQYLYGQRTALPDVAGRSYEDAKTTLQAAGFRVKKGGKTPSNDIAEGAVISSDPGSGTMASAGTLVTLTLSSGPEQEQPQAQPTAATVPNVVGMTLQDARSTLATQGFQSPTVFYPPGGTTGSCKVGLQDPAADGATQVDPAATQLRLAVDGTPQQCP